MNKEPAMYSPVRLAWKYLQYYFTAANGKGHGIHSPFVFDFVTRVLNDRGPYPAWAAIEELRGRLLRDHRLLGIEDMGAGSARDRSRERSSLEADAPCGGMEGYRSSLEAGALSEGWRDTGGAAGAGMGVPDERSGPRMRMRKISDIARRAAKPPKLGQLLFRIARHYQPATVLELGTSLGLSTAYLATGAPRARVISMEGSGPIIETAAENLRSLGVDAELLRGNFDVLLEPLLERIGIACSSSRSALAERGGKLPAAAGSVGLAFVDGNHRYEPTLRYFHLLMAHMSAPAVLIFDDIHWSADMEKAWAAIRADPRVYMTIDLFFIGLVFLRDEFKVKQDFTIRF
jgi:predicted O-methyltransferase YrrM